MALTKTISSLISTGRLALIDSPSHAVTRVPDPNDRRAKLVLPTARGHEVIAIAHGLVPELEAGLRSIESVVCGSILTRITSGDDQSSSQHPVCTPHRKI
jgi:DNA-binding MarR family transcriptional regulator